MNDVTPDPQTRTIDAKLLGMLWSISTSEAAVILAAACARKEIYGREFFGGIKYEVSKEWIDDRR